MTPRDWIWLTFWLLGLSIALGVLLAVSSLDFF